MVKEVHVKEIIENCPNKISIKDMAAKLKVTAKCIRGILTRNGIDFNKNKPKTIEEKMKIYEKYTKDNITAKIIAEEFSIHEETVYSYVKEIKKKLGVE